MDAIWPFLLIIVVFAGMQIYMNKVKKYNSEEPLWRLVIRGVAVIILSCMFYFSANLSPVLKVIAFVLCTTMAISSTIQIVKKVRA